RALGISSIWGRSPTTDEPSGTTSCLITVIRCPQKAAGRSREITMGTEMNARADQPRDIVALIPAHNEEESVERTIAALREQTLLPDRIIVIADNCTDATSDLARNSGAEVMVTEGNTHKKAGALNYALEQVLPALSDRDAVLIQD